MATIYWQGQATAVAQVDTCQITGYDAGSTYTLTVGGYAVSVAGTTDAAGTAAALAAAWNAATHPYCTAVTASSVTDTVHLTADTAGVPFVVTSSVADAGGTIGAVTASTANAGPNVWAAANFSGGAAPVADDTVIFENSSVSVLWGLSNAGATLTELRIMQSYTGKIGLPEASFATSATASDTSKPEYRDCYLIVDATLVRIGEHYGSGTPAGSGRIKIDNGTVQTALVVSNSSAPSTDGNLEPIRWKGTNANNAVNVMKGRLGIATSYAGEVATVAALEIAHLGNVASDADVNVGPGVTLAIVEQSGGEAVIQCAVTTIIEQAAGTVTTIGDGAITTVNAGGTARLQATGTIGTLRVAGGGSADLSRDPRARTISACELHKGGSLNLDNGNPLSITLSAGIDLIRCGLEDVTLRLGNHYTVEPTSI